MDLDCYHAAAGVYRASVCEGANSHAAAVNKAKKQPKNPPAKEKKESAGRRPRKQKAPKTKDRRRSSERLRDFWSCLCLRESLVYLTLLVPAYAFAQSFVGGDLAAQAPYGLPAHEFAAAAADPASNTTFPITGYNTSLSADAADDASVDGWSLNIRVLANVPLANSSRAAINKALYMDATAMSIAPPAGVAGFNASAWRVCAIVFTGGLRAGGATHADGSCTGVLAEDCIDQMQANSLANNAGRTSGCRDLEVPTNCGVHFNGLTGTGYGECCRRGPTSSLPVCSQWLTYLSFLPLRNHSHRQRLPPQPRVHVFRVWLRAHASQQQVGTRGSRAARVAGADDLDTL